MGIVEGLFIWAGTSALFCLSVGRLLHAADERNQREAERRIELTRYQNSALRHS